MPKFPPSPYALVARRLIDLGYAALPVGPGTKVPGHYARGHWHKAKEWATKFLKRLPTQYEVAYWEDDAKEPAGVCVVLGQSSRNLLTVDIDDETVVNAIVAVLPHTPCIKRGAKGQSLIFRVEDTTGLYSTSFSRPIPLTNRRQRVVDILFEGRQTVLPPTIHPDTGQPYQWIGERALEQTPYEEIPVFAAEHLAKIAAALVPFDIDLDRDKPKEAPSDGEIDDDGPFGALKAHAYRNLDMWVPKLGIYKLQAKRNGYEGVAHWRPSNTGRPLAKRNRNLSISNNPDGIVDYGDGVKGYNPFTLTAACDVCPPGDEFMWLARTTNWGPEGVYHDPQPRQKPAATEPPAGAISGLDHTSGLDRELPATGPEPVAPAPEPETPAETPDSGPLAGDTAPTDAGGPDLAESPPAVKRPTLLPMQPCPPPPKSTPPEEFERPESLTPPTSIEGLVGDITRYIVDISPMPLPMLALGSALTIVGAFCGRQVAGPTRSGTHLFVVGVAPTGTGKNEPLAAIPSIIIAAGTNDLLGAGRYTSESSIMNSLMRMPVQLAPIDEIGEFLGRFKGRNASTHEKGMSAALRQLWSCSYKFLSGTERAQQARALLNSPCFSMYGVTTYGELYDNIAPADLSNGLLNRFLIIETDKRPAARDIPITKNISVPSDIIEGCLRLWNRGGINKPQLADSCGGVEMTPDIIPFDDDHARVYASDFKNYIDYIRNSDADKQSAYARTYEMTIRIATIIAVGRHDPAITKHDLIVAASLACDSAESLLKGVTEHMAENDRHRWSNQILQFVRRMGGEATDAEIKAKFKMIHSSALKDIINILVEIRQIERYNATDHDKDTKTVYKYRAINYPPRA